MMGATIQGLIDNTDELGDEAENSGAEHGPIVAEPRARTTYRRMSDVVAEPIQWLWRERFARGKVSIIAGNPGLGKSQVTISMAAIVSRGGDWPIERMRARERNSPHLRR